MKPLSKAKMKRAVAAIERIGPEKIEKWLDSLPERNPRSLWLPKFKMLPEKCSSCPFRDGNDKEFGAIMQKLADSAGIDAEVSVHESRGRIKAEVEHQGDFLCHGSVYDKKMGKRPQVEHRQCPGAADYFRAAGLRAVAEARRKK